MKRVARLLLVAVLVAGLAGCGNTIAGLNARPDRYYQKKVSFTGRIARAQTLHSGLLLEVVDTNGARILVRTTGPVDASTGDWVEVKGILVPETQVEETVLYDVVAAERVERTRAPRLRNLM